jgi:type II secretory pathway pseudopilin PulG
LCGLLSSSGRYKEATDILNRIGKGELSKEILIQYYKNYRDAYSNLSFHTTLNENTEHYVTLSNLYADSLLAILDVNAEEYLSIIEGHYRADGHLLKSKKTNTHRMAMVESGTSAYAKVAYDRAQIYRVELDIENQKRYLILSAISDIQASVKDNASMADIALLLNKEETVDKAYKYISFAMEDVVFFNSSLRFLSLSSILPIITDDYQRKSDKQKSNLRRYLKIISLLSMVLVFALVFIYRQVRTISKARNDLRTANNQLKELNSTLNSTNNQLNGLNTELSEANHVKEQYIGNFLTICSNYIDKLDSYRKMVNKQISNRKVDELFTLTKSQKIIETEVMEFYENFDNTFLSIYPNFVAELNALLIHDERINFKNGELLNTELRIFALIRLGINDSSKIAKLLRYSVNTIYNYRVKIKNKAAGNRDDFENTIMQIGACSK